MLNCKEYSFLVKEDVEILHEDIFGGQLVFYTVLFANGCYGLYQSLSCIHKVSKVKIKYLSSLAKNNDTMRDISSFPDLIKNTLCTSNCENAS